MDRLRVDFIDEEMKIDKNKIRVDQFKQMIENCIPKLRKDIPFEKSQMKEWFKSELECTEREKFEKNQTPWFSMMKRYEFEIEREL